MSNNIQVSEEDKAEFIGAVREKQEDFLRFLHDGGVEKIVNMHSNRFFLDVFVDACCAPHEVAELVYVLYLQELKKDLESTPSAGNA